MITYSCPDIPVYQKRICILEVRRYSGYDRNTLSDLPEIIDTEINLRRTEKNALKAAIEIGRYFSDDNKAIKKAYKKALISYPGSLGNKLRKGIFPGELLDNSANRVQNRNKQNFSPIYDMINIKNEDKYKIMKINTVRISVMINAMGIGARKIIIYLMAKIELTVI